jgi:hypothetical protein
MQNITKLKNDAVQKGLFSINNEGYLTENNTKLEESSLYEEKRVFAASVMNESTYYGSEIYFYIDQSLYFSNTDEKIHRLAIDFDDNNGFRTVNFNENIKVNYLQRGLKRIKLKAEFQNQSILISNFSFRVKALRMPQPHDTWQIKGSIDYAGGVATGKAYIYTTDKTPEIRNPVIVVEGFDPENIRNWEELYNIVNKEYLAERLRAAGHDLVILNFDNGADYIQRNAFLLIELINQINREKADQDKDLAIIGASMGGIISRYALAYMEQNNIPHKTRLFISFDSPQQGANIPVGIQYWLDFFDKDSTAAEDGLNQVNSIASKQMLVLHYDTEHSPHNLRKTLLEELDNLNYPVSLKKVAIANGSGYGISQSFQPRENIVHYNAEGFVGLPYVKIATDVYAVPAEYVRKKVFYGRMWAFGIIRDGYEYDGYVTTSQPFDSAPGGMADTAKQLADSDPPIGSIKTSHPKHCFIPTISALDIRGADVFHDISNDQYILSNTPFDEIYFPKENEDHITITKENAEYFFNEIHPYDTLRLQAFPTSRNISITENIVNFNIDIQGSTSKEWSADTNETWLHIIDRVNITTSKGKITVKCDLCNDCQRIGIITISSPGVENSPITVTVCQGFENSDYYWVGGSGNWSETNHWAISSGGKIFYNSTPRAANNVYFDDNSFTEEGQSITLDINADCNDIDWREINNEPTFIMNKRKTLYVNGSFYMSYAMNIDFAGITFSSDYPRICFKTTQDNQTIITGAKALPHVQFEGTGSWVLNDLFESKSIEFKQGSLYANGQNVVSSSFDIDNSTDSSIYLDHSIITTNSWDIYTGPEKELILDSGTSIIKIIQSGYFRYHCYTPSFDYKNCIPINFYDVIFYSDDNRYNSIQSNLSNEKNLTFNTVTFKGNGKISGDNFFQTLNFFPEMNYILDENTTQSIVNFNANGNCKGSTTIQSSEPGKKANIEVAEGNVNLHRVMLKDIHAIGDASFNAIESSDEGNNDGWNFIPNQSRQLYWVGGSGNWDDISHWKYIKQDGQVIYPACVPTSIDDVYFNKDSFESINDTVTINVKVAKCRNMDWRNANLNPNLKGSGTLKIYGSFYLCENMKFLFSGNIYFLSTEMNQLIATANHELSNSLYFQGSGGWILLDPLKVETYFGSDIIHENGSLNTNGQSISCSTFESSSNNNRTLIFGSSIISANYFSFSNDNLFFDAGNSTVQAYGSFSIKGDNPLIFYDVVFKGVIGFLNSNNNVFHEVTFTENGEINGDNTFDILLLTSGKTLELKENSTQTINNKLIVNGNCKGALNIKSSYGGNASFIKINNNSSSNNIILDNVALKDINIIGNSTLQAINSIDLGNNSGIEITGRETRNLYWVGGVGEWGDVSHWSSTSGGEPGECIPTPFDNAIFDEHSFLAPDEGVTIDVATAQCRDMNWTNALNQPYFIIKNESYIKNFAIFGSLYLSPEMSFNISKVNFCATKGDHVIKTNGNALDSIYFQGNGAWSLTDDLHVSSAIYLESGTLNTNSYTVVTNYFNSTSSNSRSLMLGSSTIKLRSLSSFDFKLSYFSLDNENLYFDSGQSTIVFYTDIGRIAFGGEGTTKFNNIEFFGEGCINCPPTHFNGTHSNGVFNSIKFHSHGRVYNSHSIENLILSNGKTYIFDDGSEQSIKELKIENLEFCSGTTIIKSSFRHASFINMDDNKISINNVVLQDIHALGDAPFIADDSLDLGNNTGWIINNNTDKSKQLFWVGGSGNWSDKNHWSEISGGKGGECIPTFMDNVYFDDKSFLENEANTITINEENAFCRNMNWTVTKPNLPNLHGVSFVNNFGNIDYSDLYISGSLTLTDNMVFNMEGTIFFIGNDYNTILTANNTLSNTIFFRGSGQWELIDSLKTSKSINFNRGELITNSHTIECSSFESLNSNPRSLFLGNSNIYASNSWRVDKENLNLDSATSTIIFTSFGYLTTSHENISNYNNIIFQKSGNISGCNSFNTLEFSSSNSYKILNKQIILNHFNANGNCDNYIKIYSVSSSYPAEIHKEEGSIELNNVHLQNIHTSGNASFIAKNSIDGGNNTGWLFEDASPRNLYWVGGTGFWNEKLHWSLSSAGEGGECLPTSKDTVFFDNNSFLNNFDTVTINVSETACKDLIWLETDKQPVFINNSDQLYIYGSLSLLQNMQLHSTGNIFFEASEPGQIIMTGGHHVNSHIYFQGDGEWILQDNFDVTNRDIYFIKGALNTNDKQVICRDFRSDSSYFRKLKLGTSVINVNYWDSNLTQQMLDSGTSTIKISVNTNSSNKYSRFDNNDEDGVFNHINFIENGMIYGNNHLNQLTLMPGYIYKFYGTQSIKNNFEANGTCKEPITIVGYSYSAKNKATIDKNDGQIIVNHVLLKNLKTSGGADFIAENSIDLGYNDGWFFRSTNESQNLFWVNGTGSWNDSSHWSFISGGDGGACIPGPKDNVFFDENSFSKQYQSVSIDEGFVLCNNMDWSKALFFPTFTNSTSFILYIHGSLTLTTEMAMNLEGDGNIYFRSEKDDHNNITLSNQTCEIKNEQGRRDVYFQGQGSWIFYDRFDVGNSRIKLIEGTIITNGQEVNCSSFYSDNQSNNKRSVILGNSTFNTNEWYVHPTNFQLDAGTSLIRLSGNSRIWPNKGNSIELKYFNILFEGQSNTTSTLNHPAFYNSVKFNNNGVINGDNTFNELVLSPGHSLVFNRNKTQTIHQLFQARGNECFPISITSDSENIQANIFIESGVVSCDYIHLKNINATGGSAIYAGKNSIDISNNTGWIFNNSPVYEYGLGHDTFISPGNTLKLYTTYFNGDHNTVYTWSDGTINNIFLVSQPGTYQSTANYSSNCKFTHSIKGLQGIKGDINGDQEVGSNDAVLALKLLSGAYIDNLIHIGNELDNNGYIGMEEVLYILKMASK